MIATAICLSAGAVQAQEARPREYRRPPPPASSPTTGPAAAAPASTAPLAAPPAPSDPFERVNRATFGFNKRLDRAVLGPVARGYKAVTPAPVRKGVRNVLRNLGKPVVFANDVLQGDIGRAGDTVIRFTTNSTLGVLGVFDVATGLGLPDHHEDFGQTLGKYGAKPGPYLVVPVIGPTTVRDAAGRVVDSAVNPITGARYDAKDVVAPTASALEGVDRRANAEKDLQALEATATDEYATVRSLYLQARENDIKNGAATERKSVV